jgi:hypothetical protein
MEVGEGGRPLWRRPSPGDLPLLPDPSDQEGEVALQRAAIRWRRVQDG